MEDFYRRLLEGQPRADAFDEGEVSRPALLGSLRLPGRSQSANMEGCRDRSVSASRYRSCSNGVLMSPTSQSNQQLLKVRYEAFAFVKHLAGFILNSSPITIVRTTRGKRRKS
jgi:hypothetical protein